MNSATAESIYRRDKLICQYCHLDGSGSFAAWRSLSLDHLLPKGHPQRHDPEFIVVACLHCNILLAQQFKSPRLQGETFDRPNANHLIRARRDLLSPRLEELRTYWQEITSK